MSFPQHLAMSTKLKALETKTAQRPGHHYYWEYGYTTLSWKNDETPSPKVVGYTVRIFGFFTNDGGTTEVRLRYSNKYSLSSMIEHSQYKCHSSGYDNNDKKRYPKKEIRLPEQSFFSIAVRIHQSDTLASLYEEDVMFTENVGDILSYKYYLGLATTGHSIVSLHITNELSNAGPPYWGSDSIARFVFPVNTVGVYTVVYIQLDDGNSSSKVYFTNEVAQGQELCFVVTLASKELMISNDFDFKKPVTFLGMSAPYYVAAHFPAELVLKKLEVVSTRPY
ncbi:uncharacterized protein [Dermacentor albipictus]|uniref:uncharacterized protein isoform X2 n=1 Tax=Dermacentor albipictus TaxID=60249 RepID=UPI0038FD3881